MNNKKKIRTYKKNILTAALLAVILSVSACSSPEAPADSRNGQATVQSGTEQSAEAEEKGQAPEKKERTADYDISKMSDTLKYSSLQLIYADLGSYKGKVIKLSGVYVAYADATGTAAYDCCEVADATACCSLGFEFVDKEITDSVRMERFGKPVTVEGRLEPYDENGNTYWHLVDTEVAWGDAGTEGTYDKSE